MVEKVGEEELKKRGYKISLLAPAAPFYIVMSTSFKNLPGIYKKLKAKVDIYSTCAHKTSLVVYEWMMNNNIGFVES